MLVSAPGYSLKCSGVCPVQGYGAVDDFPAYFRARGSSWRLDIFAKGIDIKNWWKTDDEPIFTHGGDADNDGPFEAGWMEEAEVAKHISEAVDAWRKWQAPRPDAD